MPNTINMDALESYVQLVQRESMFDPTTELLMQGASEGLHQYLHEHGDKVAGPTASTMQAFKQEFQQAVLRHPELARNELFYAAMHGMLKPLDEPYTRFMTPTEYEHLQARVDGTDNCGLGVHLELDDNKALTVVEAFADTPAAGAGLEPGDRIVAIDGRPTANTALSAAKEALGGAEGSPVRLRLVRHGDTVEVVVHRARVEIPNVTWQLLAPRVGYIRLHAFSANAASDLDRAMARLDGMGASSYILDLRDNRGGYVSSAIDVCSRFLPAGATVMSLQQKRLPPLLYRTYPIAVHKTRLVLLVNERTASASEIVTGCLQDYKVATVLGTRTFGKGLVQKVIPLPDGSAFAISTGKYLTALGRDLNKHGIAPDIAVGHNEYTTITLDPEIHQAAVLLEAVQRTGVTASAH